MVVIFSSEYTGPNNFSSPWIIQLSKKIIDYKKWIMENKRWGSYLASVESIGSWLSVAFQLFFFTFSIVTWKDLEEWSFPFIPLERAFLVCLVWSGLQESEKKKIGKRLDTHFSIAVITSQGMYRVRHL